MSGAADVIRTCHDCGSADLRVAQGYSATRRVTSDCKPWPAGGQLALCRHCGLVQTIADDDWRRQCDEIYRNYAIYHQSGGIEQAVFVDGDGAGQARSDAIVSALTARVSLPAHGNWLDIGCGNGAMLTACSRALPDGWRLAGTEVNGKYKTIVEGIPHVDQLFTCPVEEVPRTFDVISLIHVIEHVPHPRWFLRSVAAKLNPGGLILLQVPDCRRNFFMLTVADHCSHFSAGMLRAVTASAGYEIVEAADHWVPKEISVLARRPRAQLADPVQPPPLVESEQVFAGWDTLQRIIDTVETLSQRATQFGIFGTSIAATWIDAQTGGAAKFFVDEDPSRIGKEHRGRSILSPARVPDGADVFLALPPTIAGSVGARLRVTTPKVHYSAP